MIRKFNLPEWKVHEIANCHKGIRKASIMLNSVLTNKKTANLGYMSVTDYYLKICKNQGSAVYRTVRTVLWEVG